MAQPYVGEIRMFAGNFAPAGWAFCDGSPQAISENETLFQLIGTTYGGDGQSTFNLPDLRGRIPVHQGSGFLLAESGGAEEVTLTVNQLPIHNHALMAASNNAIQTTPATNIIGTPTVVDLFRVGNAASPLAPQSIGSTVGSQPHTNFQPYLCINFIISLYGIFPSQT